MFNSPLPRPARISCIGIAFVVAPCTNTPPLRTTSSDAHTRSWVGTAPFAASLGMKPHCSGASVLFVNSRGAESTSTFRPFSTHACTTTAESV